MKLLILSWNLSQILSFQILLIQMTKNMLLRLRKWQEYKKQEEKKNSSLKLMLTLVLANQMMLGKTMKVLSLKIMNLSQNLKKSPACVQMEKERAVGVRKINQPPLKDAEAITPLQYFKQFWHGNVCEHLAQQTNLYKVQESEKSIEATKEDMEVFFGI